ncbi:MAG: SdiA-regulated domain-containing protein [bacterium]
MIFLKRKFWYIEVFIIVLFLLASYRINAFFSHNNKIPYELTHPTDKFKLPNVLDEISGISYLEQNKLACIQDEKGIIYVFDMEKGKVTERYEVGKKNDYEDIEIVKNTAYMLQSNGTLLKIENFREENPRVKKYNTVLSHKNDAEGLSYNSESNSLLIACKSSPYLKDKSPSLKGKRAIYAFDLDTETISKEPAYTIDMGDVTIYPSGIAVHPRTKNIYIISSAKRILILLNQKGDIIGRRRLHKKIFKQPEGICFSPQGDLFISNESRDGKANILVFRECTIK